MNCYSTGNIANKSSAICGAGYMNIVNCYSAGTIDTPGNGIYGYEKVNGTEINCYAANNNWNNDTQVEASVSYGEDYLKIVREEFKTN